MLDRSEESMANDVLMDPIPGKEFNDEVSPSTGNGKLIEGDIIPDGVEIDKDIFTGDVTAPPVTDEEFNRVASQEIADETDLANRTELFEGDIIPVNVKIDEEIVAGDVTAPPVTDAEFNEEVKSNGGINEGPLHNAIPWDNKKWPKQGDYVRIPFVMSAGLSNKAKREILNGMKWFHAKTCIRFKNKLRSDKDYLHIYVGGGCSSYIGRIGGGQQVSIGRGCETPGIAAHELMHAAGFWHEQSRKDRDEHIVIHWLNIQQGMDFNFKTAKHSTDLGTEYDLCSLMHYGPYAFSRSRGRPTITVKAQNPVCVIGQRRMLSNTDLWKLNRLYNCPSTPTVTTTQRPLVCADKNKNCAYWSSNGYCRTNEHKSYMKKNCPKSCQICTAPTTTTTTTTTTRPTTARPAICRDLHRSCSTWASSGYCSNSQHRKYMSKNCMKSCRFCNCADKKANCPSWATSGYCQNSSWKDYMKRNCKKSCQMDKNVNCAAWASRGYCQSANYQVAMSQTCQKSCDIC